MYRLKLLSVLLFFTLLTGAVYPIQVTGTVKAKTIGTPIAGAIVQAKRVSATTNDTVIYRSVTNPDGSYILQLPMPGNYNFNVSAQGYFPVNRGPIAIGDTVAVLVQNFELEKVSPTANGYAGNTYDDSTRLALPGVTLVLRSTNSNTVVYTVTSGDLGMFKFSGMKKGTYQLTAEKTGYQPYQHATLIAIDTNTNITNVKIYLKKKVTTGVAVVSGAVYKSSQLLQIPIVGALVKLALDPNGTGYSARTDSLGRYQIPNVPYGNYTASCEAAGYQPASQPLAVQTAQVALNFQLFSNPVTTGASVSGSVYNDTTRLPVGNVKLDLVPNGSLPFLLTVYSNDAGAFKFQQVPPGQYSLKAQKEGYLNYVHPSLITIVDTTSVTNLKIYLKPAGTSTTSRIAGMVFKQAIGAVVPLPGATVRLMGVNGTAGWTTVSDSLGQFTFAAVPYGTYAATCTATGYLTATQTLTVQLPVTQVAFYMTPSSVGNGPVVGGTTYNDSTRLPLANVRLYLKPNVPTPIFPVLTTVSDNTGKFTFTAVPRGDYRLMAEKEGFIAYTHATIIHVDSSTVINDLKIYLKPLLSGTNATVKGVVTAQGSSGVVIPVIGAVIKLIGTNSNQGWTAVSDSLGQFVIANVPYGQYTATCTAVGYSVVTKAVPVQAPVVQIVFNLSGNTIGGFPVAGNTFNDSTRLPLGGVNLVLKPVAPSPTVPAFTTTSNDAGAFKFASVPAGEYQLGAEKTGYITYIHPTTIHVDSAVTGLKIFLKPLLTGGTGKVKGRVFTESGAAQIPVAGAKLTINGIISFVPVITYSDSLGQYSFNVVPFGSYTLTCEAAGFAALTKPLLVQTALTEVNFALTRASMANGVVSGNVYDDSTRLALKNAKITLKALGANSYLFTVASDSAGAFIFKQLPRASYLLTADREGYKTYTHNANIVIDSGTVISNLKLYMKKGSGGTTIGATLKGRVFSKISSTGPPVPNAFIRLIGPDTLVYSGHSDSMGYYAIKNIKHGTYMASCSAQGFLTVSTSITIQAAVVEFNFYLQPVQTPGMAAIKGKVFFDGANGAPIKGAVIEFLGNAAGVAYSAVTDIEGKYTGMVPAGTYIVSCKVSRPDMNYIYKEYYDNVLNIAQATPVPVQANDTIIGINFGIPQTPVGNTITVGITGKVRNNANAVLANALVTVLFPMLNDSSRITAITSNTGEYVIHLILNRADSLKRVFVVMATKEGFKPEFYKEKAALPLADKFYVLGDTVFSKVDFTLEPAATGITYSITGKVTDMQALPLAGAFVIGSNAATSELVFSFTDALGKYSLANLKAGKYYLLFAATGYVPEFYNNVLRWENATPIIVNNSVSGINADLHPAAVIQVNQNTITGVICDDFGSPLQSVLVWLTDEFGNFLLHTFTDGNGAYEMQGLEQGSYILSATKVAYVTHSQVVQYNPQITSTLVLNLTMPQSPTVDVESGNTSVANEFALVGNYPNPFNPSTMIKFGLQERTNVTLAIYNQLGQQIATLVSEEREAGYYAVEWNASNLSSGIYFVEMRAEKFRSVKKMILMK